ncbi:MAG: porin [Pseudomonadota bacterium]|nr:porin [Pseudomonadota bacterium]
MLRIRLAAIAGAIASVSMALALPAYADDASLSAATAKSIEPGVPVAGCTPESENQNFLDRLKTSYGTHLQWDGSDATAAPAVMAGGTPVPESNPPWPYSTWNVGGSETIGAENMYYNALMDALYCGKGGQRLKDSRFTIYGWVEPGANLSTSHTRYNYATGTGGNFPAAYSFEPNTVQLDQAALYFERTPDEVQRDHFDWGGRFTALYGTDYKYTFANGILSNQYLDSRRQYGFDPVMYYLDFWFPRIAEGENIRVGRYISIPDIEAQLAPNNLTYSHSLLYTYDPYTQNGIVSTTKLDKNWQFQAELSAGNDVAPWVKSERHLTPAACVIWTSNSGNDNIYPCMNGINDSRWRWNNVQHAVVTWYHKFNSAWHMDTEVWYMWQSHTPNINNPAGLAAIGRAYAYANVGAPNGAQCNPTVVYCYSYEWAVLNYLNYQIGPRDIVTWRTDTLNDARGQRTGFKTRYYEFGMGYTHWVGDTIELRPELRYEHARDVDAYDNPTATRGAGKNSQTMIAADAIFHF